MKEYGFGLDLGGTTCKMGLFKADGTLLEKWEIRTDTSDGGSKILPNIAASVLAKMEEKKLTKDDVFGVGIGVPGPVSSEGVVNKCANLGWGVTPAKEILSELLGGILVEVGNDANVAALGEAWMGAGKNYESVVMVTLGTGVGGGVVINNKIVGGATGSAGEIGHIRVRYDEEETCGCGLSGHLEQYASATGIARIARQHLEKDTKDSALRNTDDVDARTVFNEAKAGDALAIEVMQEAMGYLAQGLQIISCTVNPEAFVIGGGVSKAGQILIDEVTKQYQPIAFHSCRDTQIVLAELGNDAGMYGAMKMVM